jgi:hypothetical protein
MMEIRFEFKTIDFDIMLNTHNLSKKFKLKKNSEFNYLIYILTII